jgi:hypothetical protein
MILFLLLAILGFFASVLVHLSTFNPGAPVTMSESWPPYWAPRCFPPCS